MEELLNKFKTAITATGAFKECQELTHSELTFLATKWLGRRNWLTGERLAETLDEALNQLATFENSVSVCGCMGAMPNEPWCNCLIWTNMAMFKYEVGIFILENDLKLM